MGGGGGMKQEKVISKCNNIEIVSSSEVLFFVIHNTKTRTNFSDLQ